MKKIMTFNIELNENELAILQRVLVDAEKAMPATFVIDGSHEDNHDYWALCGVIDAVDNAVAKICKGARK